MFYYGIVIISLIGAFLHFLYEISGHNKAVAVFAAVNESTWEHIKIGMTATIIWSLYDGFVYGIDSNYLIGKSMCLLTIIILIPMLFYTYTLFTKKAILIVDIICFCITIYCSQWMFYHYLSIPQLPFIYTYFGTMLLFFEISAYLTLTYLPFKNFFFEDPITHKYGLEGHPCGHHHNHKKHKELIIILICLVLLSGCVRSKKELSKTLEVDISKCSFENESKRINGFVADSEYFAILNCSKFDAESLTDNWKKLPLPSELTEVLEMARCDSDKCLSVIEEYNIPEVENGYYFFKDRHSHAEDKYSTIPLNDRDSYNFSLGIYDLDNKMLYYYELDT